MARAMSCAACSMTGTSRTSARHAAAGVEFLKTRGFFAMIIPKKYGGLNFPAYAHSCVLAKIASRSATASSTVAVPNSLGPAELLILRYRGAEERRPPRPGAARCRASRSPVRAGPMPAPSPTPASCRGTYQGRAKGGEAHLTSATSLPAPVAPSSGSPSARSIRQAARRQGRRRHHLRTDPAHTPGVIGRRHFPLNILFQNGPIQGRDGLPPVPSSAGPRWRAAAAHAGGQPRGLHSLPSMPPALRRPFGRRGLRAHPHPVQHAGRQVRGRGSGDARMVGLTLHDRCRPLGDRRAIDGGEKPSVPSGS
jgi:acyl-CoA dehydrogenase